MKQDLKNMVYIDEIREKLGIIPKKCQYTIVKGEAIIFKIEDEQKYSA